jgi:membrane carboxypeptidase/penicillin-binding protein
MKRALAGRGSVSFKVPEGMAFADIDYETGQLATPSCPRVVTETFIAGTEPTGFCSLHGGQEGRERLDRQEELSERDR